MKNIYQSKLPGFSLMEAAFFLLIVGIATSLTFPFLKASQRLERHKVTESNQHQIFHALAGYVLKHYCLPLPSMPELAGQKGTSCLGQENSVCVGILPYQELGLSESVARDGHGHWFTYAVVRDLVRPRAGVNEIVGTGPIGVGSLYLGHSSGGECFCRVISPGLSVNSLADISALNADLKKDFIAVVLVSHGPKGTGAFQQTTSTRLPFENSYEQKNSMADNLFVMRTSQDINADFSHEVYWVTRNNLMAIYGNHPCQPIPKDITRTGAMEGNPNVPHIIPGTHSVPPSRSPVYMGKSVENSNATILH